MTTHDHSSVYVQAVDLALEINIVNLNKSPKPDLLSDCRQTINDSYLIIECEHGKYVIVFSYGSMVTFGLSEDEYVQMLMYVKKFATNNNREIHRINYSISTGHLKPKIFKEELRVENLTTEIVTTVAIVLARAVSLKYYEYSLKTNLNEMSNACGELSVKQQPRPKLKKLHQIVSGSHSVQLELLNDIQIREEPEFSSSSRELINIYNGLTNKFCIRQRLADLERKVETINTASNFIIHITSCSPV